MKTISTIILEDNPLDYLSIRQMLSDNPSSYQYKIVEVFETLSPLLSFIEKREIDLIISNIFIKNQPAGIELLKHLKDTNTPIVFITNTPQKEIFEEIQKVKCVPYLIKPFHAFTLLSTLDNLTEDLERSKQYDFMDKKYLYLSGIGGNREPIFFKDIVYLNSNGNHCFIHTAEKKYVLKKSLNKMLLELGTDFIRIHQQFIVNKTYLKKVFQNQVELKGHLLFPIGKTFRKTLIAYLKMPN